MLLMRFGFFSLHRLLFFFIVSFLFTPSLRLYAQVNDAIICNHVFSYAFEHKLIEQPIGTVIAGIGKQFLGKPYEAHTLDRSPQEQLITNLHSFDCVTFIENVLALSLCIKSNRLSFAAYREELQALRYRDGIIKGYQSRLHYFTDWIYEHEKSNILHDITEQSGGKPLLKVIQFMTTHRSLYAQLSEDSVFNAFREIESRLAARKLYFIPKSELRKAQEKIQEGDILAITTTIEGLDVSHTGIAVRGGDGVLHYMHAPNVNGSVKISDEPLWKYVQQHSTNSGIIVVRVVEIKE